MATTDKPKTKERRGRKKGYSAAGEKILQILSAAAETLDTVGDFAYNPYPYIYASLGHVHDKKTIDGVVNDLIGKGLIEESKNEGLRLTPVGADVEKSLIRARKKEWDGKWRVVSFDIPEAQRHIRDGLRRELKKLGFGLWQRSAWITPFDIAEELGSYLQKEGLSRAVQILVGERFGELSDQDFASEIWPLKEINERYQELLNDWGEELEEERSGEERLQAAAILHQCYLNILETDPCLPKKLLPDDWLGDDAQDLFKKLKSILAGGKVF